MENRPLKERIDTPPEPKDEFETTAQYKARLRKHREQIDPLKKKYETGYNAIMRKYEEESENNDKKYNHEMGVLLNSTYFAEGIKPVLIGYNADKKIYKLKLIEPDGRYWEYELPIEPGAARELSRRKNTLEVEGFYANIDALFLCDQTGTGQVWVVSFFLGAVADYRGPVQGIYVRPVRSGRIKGGLASSNEQNAETQLKQSPVVMATGGEI